ncbi:hypothetical protein GJ496_004961 [Pomphorhynchus laevis]|nr:hypothetical protein GJ496_004961 [Pomphorhynchus laevis]
MRGRIDLLKLRYQCLVETSLRRDGRLNKGLAARHLLEDIINENEWIKTKIKELRDDDDLLQADWLGSQALSNRYEAIKSEIITKQPKIDEIEKRCNLMHNNEIYQESIKTEFNNVREKWEELYLASEERSNALRKAQNLHLLQAKTDESNAWMLEMLRLVSSDDVGRDEHTAQNLLRKHGEVQNMLYAHREQIDQLTEVEQRVTSLQRRFNELLSISSLRQRKLEEAIHLFRLFHDVDNVESWITEKQRFLYSLDPAAASDIEELEVMKDRFDGFERELYASASKVAVVNNLARQLVSDDHPGSQHILDRLNNLNQKWADLRKLVDSKRDELQSTFGVQTFHIECDETISWIQDKVKIVQSTEYLGRDLSGVIIMQRRLSGLERDLNAIQAKLDQLDMEAERLEQSHPLEAIAVHKKINQMNAVCQWLTRTQTLVASEDIPDLLQSAEQILNRHQSIKEKIDRYSPDYAQMRDYGQRVIRDADSSDPQYVFLRERLNALDDGWNELDQMWHQKQNMLSEAMHLQILNASEEKIQQLWQFVQRLVHESHYAADRIIDKTKGIVDRFSTNKANASNIGEQLKENIKFYQFVQDCDDLKEWLDAKTAQAQDDTYRETRNIHSKYLRHQAFSAEIAANRERLQNLRQGGYVLAEEQPNIVDAVDAKLAELDIMWETLEQTTKAKGERLFDANRDTLYQQCISDVDRFVTNIEQHLTAEELPLHTIDREVLYSANVSALEADVAGDLTRTNVALTKQTLLENEFIIKQQQVE